MLNNLNVLHRASSLENVATSDLNKEQVESAIITIYKTITGTDADVTLDTGLSDMSEEQKSGFFEQVSLDFGVEFTKEDIDGCQTIGCVVGFVMSHDGSTIGDRLQQTWNSEEFLAIQKKLDITLKMLQNYGTSEEGLGTGLLKVFIGTADLFLRVGNTFKTNLFKFFKSLKRSEIRFFWESHTLLCKTVETQPITKFMDVSVPVPTGMLKPYKDTISYIDGVFSTLNLTGYATSIYKELQDIRRQMTRGEIAYKHGFQATANSATMLSKNLQSIAGKQTDYFTDKKQISSSIFKTVFSSMKDLSDTRATLINMEKYLGDTKSLVDMIDNIDIIVGDITNYLTEDDEVDKKFIEQLAMTIRYLATAFDVYGSCAMRQMALEHNLVLVYETLYKNI